MRSIVTAVVALTAITACAAARAEESPLSSLAWMAGCWASESGEPGSGEQWMPPAGGTMLGMGRTVKNGKTVEHEFLQIGTNSEGQATYTAHPSGQKEATFVATELAKGAVTFENLEHDFPQRVIYKALPGDRLAARIEGVRDGTLRGIDFPMKRVRCEALAGDAKAR